VGRVVRVFVRVDDRAVDGFVDECFQELVGRVGVIFSRAVAVGDALERAVGVVRVRGCHAVGEDVNQAADTVVDLDRDVSLRVDGGFGRAAGVESVGNVVGIERGADVGHGLGGRTVPGIVGPCRRAGPVRHRQDVAVMVVGVRDRLRCGALGHGLAQEVPVDIVYADGDRAVPVRYGGYSSVGGVGVQCDFRKVVRIASRFAGSSSRPDQADEKVAVIVFVSGHITGSIGHGENVAVVVIGIDCRFAVGKRYPDKSAHAVVGIEGSIPESVGRRVLRTEIVVGFANGVTCGIGGCEQTVVLVVPIGGRLAECVCRGSLAATQVIGVLHHGMVVGVFDEDETV